MAAQSERRLVDEVRFHGIILRLVVAQGNFPVHAGFRRNGIAGIDGLENSAEVMVAVFTLADDIEKQVDFCRSEFFHIKCEM